MLKHKRILSYLPVFTGFYNTLFEADEETYLEDGRSVSDYEWDYVKYHLEVAKAVTSEIEEQILLTLGIKGVTVIFEELRSPKEYNFSTDSINVTYELTSDAINAINLYLQLNLDAFIADLKQRYTSRPGFLSYYSTDYTVWFNEYLTDEKKLAHCFGSILDFMFKNEGYDYEKLYYAIAGNVVLEGELI